MLPPVVLIFGVLVVGLIVAGSLNSCEREPEVDHGVEILKGGVER